MDTNDAKRNGDDSKEAFQIRLVLEAFASDDILIGAWPNRFVLDYLYERGVILVDDAYLAQVQELLEEWELRDALIDGVTALAIPLVDHEPRGPGEPEETEVTLTLDRIDRELGVGVAGPNHVFSISPGGMCPATEPEPVPAGAAPDPGVCPDRDGDGTFIYVVDTGLLEHADTHPWLAGVTGSEDSFTAPDIRPYTGHGTFVAGAARCMALGSEVYVARVLHHAGAALETDIVKHLDLAMRAGPDIISLSAGGWTRKDLPPHGFVALWRRYSYHKGVQLVAAAGNNANRRPFWPAAFPQVVSVGALSASWRTRAAFSDFGGWVDVYAPGEGIINAYATGTYHYGEPANRGRRASFDGMARWSGTSFSTPLVSGLIAARMSRTGENSRQAARNLLALAGEQALRGVGPVLYPCEEGCRRGAACCRENRGAHAGCRRCCRDSDASM